MKKNAALLFFVAFLTSCPPTFPGSRLPLLRKNPLSLRLPRVDGGILSMESLRGRPVYIIFFSTWCRTCHVSFNRLLRLQATLGKNRLGIVGISVDRDPRLLKVFVETLNLPFPILYSTPQSLEAAGIGRVRGVPTLLLLDKKGRPRAIRSQMMTTRAMGRLVNRL